MALGQILQMKGDKEAGAAAVKEAQQLDRHLRMTMAPPPEELFDPPQALRKGRK